MFKLIHPLAALFDSDTIWILIPLSALMIPIVALLVGHQQKMAQIIHGGAGQREMDAMREQLEMLRQQMQYQASLLNDLKSSLSGGQPVSPVAEDLQSRVGL